ncbi:hypothetical protein BC936DRAFT_143330 [Jimgerdemannia flammicorona]|uniref:Amine oxidase domain-containing protein n=1 Tax=Jimgerdemannia flammicorona TaxID=994334 RepID=A0A432ZZ10_9FUNG|nr:hypothetical protein BC936DRAFT_143330 [Jimgerdemannia flammicorona]
MSKNVGFGLEFYAQQSLVKRNQKAMQVGGHIRTFRDPFTPKLYVEGGAMHLPTTHFLVYKYLKKFNMTNQLKPFQQV